MGESFRISDASQLLVDGDSLAICGADGIPLLTLPIRDFVQAGINRCRVPRQNNHYHHITQTVHGAFSEPTLDHITETPSGVILEGGLRSADGACGFKALIAEDSAGLLFTLSVDNPEINRIHIRFESPEDELFFGFGEQFTFVEFSGKRFPLITGEQGVGRGALPVSAIVEAASGSAGDDFTTYAPMPLAVTSAHRAFFIDEDCVSFADIRKSRKGLVEFELWSSRCALRVWRGESMLDAIRLHSGFTGRFPPLPRWAHGVILGLRGGRRKVEEVLSRCEDEGIPVAAIWIEDWVGRRGKNGGPPLWWRWEPEDELYPDFTEWVAGFAAKGIRVLTYFNSFIADDPEHAMCRDGLDRGYFVKDDRGMPHLRKTGSGYGYYMVDLSNPEAFAWFKAILSGELRRRGVSGWMADYGEYLSFDSSLLGGVSGESYHQKYATDWLRLNREVAEESGRAGDLLIFNRCGTAYGNRYSLCFWEGDQNVAWDEHDGLASSIVGLLSGGFSGIAINHADIGGHTTIVNPFMKLIRSKELFWRWCELAAFTPVYRTHDGTLTEPNHQFYTSDDTLRFFGLMGRLHERLAEYFLLLEAEAERNGAPLVRHTALHDEAAKHMDLRYQFMLGPELVVYPVCAPGSEEVSGYAPAGKWVNPWTGERIEGSRFISLAAKLGKPAILVREDTEWGGRLLRTLSDFIESEGGMYAILRGMRPADLQEEAR